MTGRMSKRAIEILIAVVALVLVSPVLMLAALLVWIVDGGPVFHAQERVGFQGKPFRMWKIRSMKKNADEMLHEHLSTNAAAAAEWNAYLRLDRDPRHLPWIGRVLRR